MSQETVEIVRAAYAAFNRGDFNAVMVLTRPEVGLVRPSIESPVTGRDAMRAWMEPDAFAELRAEPVVKAAGLSE
jgi:ketosteroid isomerase-like protein